MRFQFLLENVQWHAVVAQTENCSIYQVHKKHNSADTEYEEITDVGWHISADFTQHYETMLVGSCASCIIIIIVWWWRGAKFSNPTGSCAFTHSSL